MSMQLSMTVLRCPDKVAPEARTVSGGELRAESAGEVSGQFPGEFPREIPREFHVGRGPDVDWVLPDPDRLLSKRHFAVAFRRGEWLIADTSTNGTWLNTESTSIGRGAIRSLRDGDRLRLGAYEIGVRLREDQSIAARQRDETGVDEPGEALEQIPPADPFAVDPMAAARRRVDAPAGPGPNPNGARSAREIDPSPPSPDAANNNTARNDRGVGPREGIVSAGMMREPPPSPSHRANPLPTPLADPHPSFDARPEPPRSFGGSPAPHPASPARLDRFDFLNMPTDGMPTDGMPTDAASTPDAPVPETAPSDPPPAAEEAPVVRQRTQRPAAADPVGEAEPPAMPAAARPVEPSPASHAPAERKPGGALGPAHPVAGDADAMLAAFFRGARLRGAQPGDPLGMMIGLGQAFRALVAGLRSVLIARAETKGEFRIEQTIIRAQGNNPLKFSANDDDALGALLGIGRRTDVAPATAIADSLRDLRLHEQATISAMGEAVRALLAELDPEAIRAATEQGGGMAVLPAQRKARAWDAYEARHAAVSRALVDGFDSVFGKSFARAYERALDEIAMKERQ
jgi:type VI secretion system FHA domain protein